MPFDRFFAFRGLNDYKVHTSGSVMAERLRAPNSNSGVSDQQSVRSNPESRDTCVLKQDTSPLLCPSDGTLSQWSHVLCNTC